MTESWKKEWRRELTVGKAEYDRLEEKAEEMNVEIEDLIDWLIEEHLDEMV